MPWKSIGYIQHIPLNPDLTAPTKRRGARSESNDIPMKLRKVLTWFSMTPQLCKRITVFNNCIALKPLLLLDMMWYYDCMKAVITVAVFK